MLIICQTNLEQIIFENAMKSFKYIWIFLLLALVTGVSLAQGEEDVPQQIDPKAREKVEAARIALITNRLGLTPEQAEKFWPIYREFSEKRKEIRKEFRQVQLGVERSKPDPKKQEELVKLGFQLKQNELNLEKDYSGRIMNIISAQQMLNLRKAEQDFRQLILIHLQQRREQRKELLRDENQRLRQNRK